MQPLNEPDNTLGMLSDERRSISGYTAAILAAGLAALVRALFDPMLGDDLPFPTFFVAVVFASWYGGLKSGLTATTVGFLLSWYLFLPPRYSFFATAGSEYLGLVRFLTAGIALSGFGEAIRIARRRSRQNQQLAAEQKEWLRTTLASIGDAVIATDITGKVVLMNKAAEDLTGRTQRDCTGHPLQDVFRIVSEQTREPIESPVNQVLRDIAVVGLTTPTLLVARDGRKTSIDHSAAPIRSTSGEIAGVVLVFRDITERRRAEERLRESEATVRSLLHISELLNSTLDANALLAILVQEAVSLVGAESGISGLCTPEGVVCSKYFTNGQFVPINCSWPAMHGLPGWSIVHKKPYLTNDAHNDPHVVHELRDRFGLNSALCIPIITAQGEAVGFFEIHNKTTGGFTPSDQELLLAVSQVAAIAVQNALAYRSLELAEQTLKEGARHKDEFLATLAHELRNPLAPVRNALELMRRAGDDQSILEPARNMMERQVTQMARLIDDLLDVSRISRGKIELRKEKVELAAVLRNAIEATRPLVEAGAHEFIAEIPAEPVYLHADATRLTQVFSNLINNAAKYTERGGRITLAVERIADEIVVSVRDTGIGISAEYLPQLFAMFSQASTALERSQGGLGVGLALVRGLVELHGGSVEARSAGLGKGSQFIVSLPIAEAASEPETQPGTAQSQFGPKRRILVVDDNRDAADSLSMLLQVGGHAVQTAHDGLEAVQTAATFRPDVVLLDIGLPRMNGYEVARHLREQPWGQAMAIFALTGWGQDEDKRRALDAGCNHHLTKPVDPAVLERLLDSTIRGEGTN